MEGVKGVKGGSARALRGDVRGFALLNGVDPPWGSGPRVPRGFVASYTVFWPFRCSFFLNLVLGPDSFKSCPLDVVFFCLTGPWSVFLKRKLVIGPSPWNLFF